MDRCGHRTSSCPFLVNVLLDELEDELSPEDRGYRVEVPVEAAEHEQFKGLEWGGFFMAECSFLAQAQLC